MATAAAMIWSVGLLPGAEFHAVWGSDAELTLPWTGDRPRSPAWFPPEGGLRFGFFTLPPDSPMNASEPPLDAAFAELAQKLPGLLERLEMDNPGRHTTDTVDFIHIVSGEVWLEVEDGAQTRLVAGDCVCVVQNGTCHAWWNKSNEPCTKAVAMIGVCRSTSDTQPPD